MRQMMLSCMVAVAMACVATSVKAADPVKVGEKAPAFTAKTTDGKTVSLEELSKESKCVVVCFTCNNCPVAVAYEDRFIEFNKKYADKGVKFVAINVNSSEDLEMMKQRVEEKGFNFPYAYDDSQESAKQYGAKVTPHLFVIDDSGKVAYIGAFDDDMSKPSSNWVAEAVDAVLAGKSPEKTSTKAVGCGIKWRR